VAPLRGGFEIVDKTARREIYIEGALAERFQRGVQALVETGANTEEAFDAYIADFAGMAQQPLVLH
jgi:predicted phage tail protein